MVQEAESDHNKYSLSTLKDHILLGLEILMKNYI